MKLPRNQCKQILAPGMWLDMDDQLHFSIPDILKHLGLPNTPEHFDALQTALLEMVRQQKRDATLIIRTKPD